MEYWFLRCSIYHIHPPRASRHRKPFATCHVTLFGWRNGGRARTFIGGRFNEDKKSNLLPCLNVQPSIEKDCERSQ
jgi:hypothetical protein